jgi:hypothetical protein
MAIGRIGLPPGNLLGILGGNRSRSSGNAGNAGNAGNSGGGGLLGNLIGNLGGNGAGNIADKIQGIIDQVTGGGGRCNWRITWQLAGICVADFSE